MNGIFILTLLLLVSSCGTTQSLKTKPEERTVANHLHQKLSHLEVQIIHLDSMIDDARFRKETTVVDRSIIDSEIFAFEAQKNSLLNQKSELQVTMEQ